MNTLHENLHVFLHMSDPFSACIHNSNHVQF